MNKTYKIILYTLIVFFLFTLVITIWYVIEFGSSESIINAISIKNIIVRYGIVGSLAPTISYLIIYFLIKKVKKTWIIYLSIALLIAVLFLYGVWFLWYTSISGLTHNPFVE
jgi:hypothetical protein